VELPTYLWRPWQTGPMTAFSWHCDIENVPFHAIAIFLRMEKKCCEIKGFSSDGLPCAQSYQQKMGRTVHKTDGRARRRPGLRLHGFCALQ